MEDNIERTKEEVKDVKGNMEEMEMEVEALRHDMDELYVTKTDLQTMVGKMVDDKIKHTTHTHRFKTEGGDKHEGMENEDRRKQVIAFGFEENTPSAAVVDRLEKLLQRLLGDGTHATVTTGANTTKM
eukprot:9501725-Pyramimonas_sp.AAC.2